MSVTAPAGFSAAAVAGGIRAGDRPDRLDLALVATDDAAPAAAAGVFTANCMPAAPVEVSRAHLAATGGRAAAVVVNSGNANAATGASGRADAERTCALVAASLSCGREEVLVCSTGLIGLPLPMTRVEEGIAALLGRRSLRGGPEAARAILTTDTRPKEVVVGAHGFTVGGMAKGAAMLAPHLATMLAVLTTDAAVEPHRLRELLRVAVEGSFNALTVDGSTSTNDTVIVLANGRSGRGDEAALADALGQACADLAAQMADDAEGATKVARVRVVGARSDDQARRAARRVAESQLVKCSLYGEDPYWGRVVSELGASGADLDPDRVSVAYGGVTVCRDGVAAEHDERALRAHLAGRTLEIVADLGVGSGAGVVLTNDLTPAYIDENRRTS